MANVRSALLLGILALCAAAFVAVADAPPDSVPATTAPVLWQPSMNVFRRFAVEPEKMFEF